jgi:hypothetical protein
MVQKIQACLPVVFGQNLRKRNNDFRCYKKILFGRKKAITENRGYNISFVVYDSTCRDAVTFKMLIFFVV